MVRTAMKLPHTRAGWVKLYWLTRRRCPVCHGALSRDWALYDRGGLWCMPCGGVHLPEGFWNALRWNDGGRRA